MQMHSDIVPPDPPVAGPFCPVPTMFGCVQCNAWDRPLRPAAPHGPIRSCCISAFRGRTQAEQMWCGCYALAWRAEAACCGGGSACMPSCLR
jgi:hypothetical protein